MGYVRSTTIKQFFFSSTENKSTKLTKVLIFDNIPLKLHKQHRQVKHQMSLTTKTIDIMC